MSASASASAPEHLLGRVNATMRFAMMTPFPAGAILGGVLGELVGPRLTLLVAGVIVGLSPLPVYLASRVGNGREASSVTGDG